MQAACNEGRLCKNGLLRKYVKMGCSEKYVKVGCSQKYVKIGCSSMLTFTKAGKVDGARQGGRDFCQAIVFLTVSLQFDCSGKPCVKCCLFISNVKIIPILRPKSIYLVYFFALTVF